VAPTVADMLAASLADMPVDSVAAVTRVAAVATAVAVTGKLQQSSNQQGTGSGSSLFFFPMIFA